MVALISTVFSVVAVVVAGVVAVVVGRRRGLDQVDERADAETKRLLEAQASRLSFLEAENARQAQQIASLQAKVTALETDLAIEKRISARLVRASESDGR